MQNLDKCYQSLISLKLTFDKDCLSSEDQLSKVRNASFSILCDPCFFPFLILRYHASLSASMIGDELIFKGSGSRAEFFENGIADLVDYHAKNSQSRR